MNPTPLLLTSTCVASFMVALSRFQSVIEECYEHAVPHSSFQPSDFAYSRRSETGRRSPVCMPETTPRLCVFQHTNRASFADSSLSFQCQSTMPRTLLTSTFHLRTICIMFRELRFCKLFIVTNACGAWMSTEKCDGVL